MDFVIYKCVIIGTDIRNRQLLQIHMTPNRKNSSGFISSVPAVFQIFNNRSKNSLTSIGDGMNCTFEHVCSNS